MEVEKAIDFYVTGGGGVFRVHRHSGLKAKAGDANIFTITRKES